MKKPNKQGRLLAALCLLLLSAGCSADSAKSRYILAEKLWNEGDYAASVSEFDKVTAKDPKGKLGLQALFRSAATQNLYLGQNREALKKFKTFTELSSDPKAVWEAKRQIGEILFVKLEDYPAAIQHYRALLSAYPEAPELPEFMFRIGRSQFFLWQFEEAIETYREIIQKYPKSPLAEKADYNIGLTYYTQGESGGRASTARSGPYQDAIQAYEAFLKNHPKSSLVPLAQFGIASCLEEMDQLDAAYRQYEALRFSYPSRKVIEIKLTRIRERKAQRSR